MKYEKKYKVEVNMKLVHSLLLLYILYITCEPLSCTISIYIWNTTKTLLFSKHLFQFQPASQVVPHFVLVFLPQRCAVCSVSTIGSLPLLAQRPHGCAMPPRVSRLVCGCAPSVNHDNRATTRFSHGLLFATRFLWLLKPTRCCCICYRS